MQTDVYGCGWVRWGTGDTWEYKNTVDRAKKWTCRVFLGWYGRGNFPGHHVLWDQAKIEIYVCRWVQTDLDGCVWVHNQGRQQKLVKKKNKQSSRTCFFRHDHDQKMQNVDKDGHRGLRGLFVGMKRKEEVCVAIWMCISKWKAKKQATESKETKTSNRKFMQIKQKEKK
jgi:hypothetical protein